MRAAAALLPWLDPGGWKSRGGAGVCRLMEEQRAAAIRMPRPAASWVPAVGPAEAARIPRNRAQLVALYE